MKKRSFICNQITFILLVFLVFKPGNIKSQTIYGITGGSGVGYLTEVSIVNGQCSVSTVGPLIDIATGLPILFHNLAICPDGVLYAQGAGYLYSINPNNGQCTSLYPTNVYNVNGLVCSPDNILYGISNNPLPHSLIELDPLSSSSTNLGPLNFWAGGDLVFYNGQLYCASDDGLFIVNIGNPIASTYVFHCGVYPALTVLPGYCNSLVGSDLDGQFFQINPDTQEETLLCSPGQYMFDFTSIAEFDPATQCPFIIDLDDDNSSGADEYDFNGPLYNCNTSNGIPICDQDVKITSDVKILSITITLEDGMLDGLSEYLKFEGNVASINVSGSGSQTIILTNTGNATITSFENALKSILYYNDADPLSPGQRKIKVTGITITGTSSNDAFAYLEVQDLTKLNVDLGPDTTLCQGITYLLDAYYPGASYQWNTGETTSFYFVTEPGVYNVTISHPDKCPGFDEVNIDYLPSKFTELILPSTACEGDSIVVKINSELTTQFDLSLQSTSGQTWSFYQISNGFHFKVKVNNSQNIYVTNISSTETECALSELSVYQIVAVPRDTIINRYAFCEGDSISIGNQWYFEKDTLVTPLKNKNGCDSLVFSILESIKKDTFYQTLFTCNPDEAGIKTFSTIGTQGCPIVNQEETILLASDTTHLNTVTCIAEDAGLFQHFFTNAAGCDSIVFEIKAFQSTITTHITQLSCNPLDTQTTVSYFLTQEGCDSTVYIHKEKLPSDTTLQTGFTCDPTKVGINVSSITNQFGCDSTIILTTFYKVTDTTQIHQFTCIPSDAGIDTLGLLTAQGCDSVVILEKIWVKPDTTLISINTCKLSEVGQDTLHLMTYRGCDSLVIYHSVYLPQDTVQITYFTCSESEAGVFIHQDSSSSGCDSLTRLTVLYSSPDTTYLVKNSCLSNETGINETRFSNVHGCDSLVITKVNFLPGDTVYINYITCDPSDAGLFIHHYQNKFGCDSIVYEDFAFVKSDTVIIDQIRCNINKDSTVHIHYTNYMGCDSIVIFNYLARPSHYIEWHDTVCRQQDTASTLILLKNEFGCDSIIEIKHHYQSLFTILPPIRTCDSIINDSVYYEWVNAAGCDSIVIQPFIQKPYEECIKAYNLILPNIIDPDRQGQNIFRIPQISGLHILFLRIYDRWGNLVYQTLEEDIADHKGWDGSFNGSLVEQGVYVYQIKVLWDGRVFFYTGDLTVVR